MNNPGILVKDEATLRQAFNDFVKHTDNMDEPYKGIYKYFAKSTVFVANRRLRVYIACDPESDVIVYNKGYLIVEKLQLPGNIIFSHELAHRFDRSKIHSWENEIFTSAIKCAGIEVSQNIEKYNELFRENTNINPAYQDILSGVGENKIETDYFHKTRYWNDISKAKEIFANLCYLRANRINIPKFDGLLDNVILSFEKLIEGGV